MIRAPVLRGPALRPYPWWVVGQAASLTWSGRTAATAPTRTPTGPLGMSPLLRGPVLRPTPIWQVGRTVSLRLRPQTATAYNSVAAAGVATAISVTPAQAAGFADQVAAAAVTPITLTPGTATGTRAGVSLEPVTALTWSPGTGAVYGTTTSHGPATALTWRQPLTVVSPGYKTVLGFRPQVARVLNGLRRESLAVSERGLNRAVRINGPNQAVPVYG